MRTRQVATLDFETDPFKHGRIPEPFCAGIYTEGDVIESYQDWWNDDPEELARDVAEYLAPRRWRVYAHNGGKFDFFFLLPYADKIKGINGRIASMQIGRCLLVDSYLILPVPLRSYGKTDIDYNKMEREHRDKNRDEILAYLRDDCVNLYQWVTEFRELFGTPLTLASASFAQMKERGIEIEKHRGESWDEKFRVYYYGGRCENFDSGVFNGPYSYIDINSAYPFAMLSEHPSGTEFERVEFLPTDGTPYFATISGHSRGALPVRTRGGLSFPHGLGTYHATSWEIEAGLDTGTLDIDDVIECYVPFDTQDFAPFINHFYSERLKAKAAKDASKTLFYKLVMNAGYGKFALNPREFKDYAILECGDWPDGEGWEINYEIGEHSIFSKPDPGDSFYNVCTAASITGYVRAYLWRAINDCAGVLYCDTDSIVCRDYGSLRTGKSLGEWEQEATIKKAWLGGKKLYALETDDGYKTASKGSNLTVEQIKRVVNGEIVNWPSEAPTFSLNRAPSFVDRRIKRTA